MTNRDRAKLGFGRVKIIEILNYILKENLLGSRVIFGSKQTAFDILFSLCKNYELNNVLHNQIVKMVSLAFSDSALSHSVIFFIYFSSSVMMSFWILFTLKPNKMWKFAIKQARRDSEKVILVMWCRFHDLSRDMQPKITK